MITHGAFANAPQSGLAIEVRKGVKGGRSAGLETAAAVPQTPVEVVAVQELRT